MRTPFEQYARDIQYRKRTGQEHPHTIETYTGNNKSTSKEARFTVLLFIAVVAIVVSVIAIIGEASGITNSVIESI